MLNTSCYIGKERKIGIKPNSSVGHRIAIRPLSNQNFAISPVENQSQCKQRFAALTIYFLSRKVGYGIHTHMELQKNDYAANHISRQV